MTETKELQKLRKQWIVARHDYLVAKTAYDMITEKLARAEARDMDRLSLAEGMDEEVL